MDAGGRCYGRTDLALRDPDAAGRLAGSWRRLAARFGPARPGAAAAWPRRLRGHRVDPRLLELDFGAWEGLPWDDVPRPALDAWAADPWRFAPPGGESGAALVSRVRAFHDALPPGDHIVIAHGGPLKVLAALVARRPVDLLAPAPAIGSVTML